VCVDLTTDGANCGSCGTACTWGHGEVCIAGACVGCVPAQELPAAFLGDWTGTGTQDNPPLDWPIAMSFAGGGVGKVVGTATYPTLGCSSDLVFEGAEATLGDVPAVRLTERVKSGPCVDGTFMLQLADDRLAFSWVAHDGGSTATGTLEQHDASGGCPAERLFVACEPRFVCPDRLLCCDDGSAPSLCCPAAEVCGDACCPPEYACDECSGGVCYVPGICPCRAERLCGPGCCPLGTSCEADEGGEPSCQPSGGGAVAVRIRRAV
jgi:hypothetical protein